MRNQQQISVSRSLYTKLYRPQGKRLCTGSTVAKPRVGESSQQLGNMHVKAQLQKYKARMQQRDALERRARQAIEHE